MTLKNISDMNNEFIIQTHGEGIFRGSHECPPFSFGISYNVYENNEIYHSRAITFYITVPDFFIMKNFATTTLYCYFVSPIEYAFL